jgi:hypothetical protein
MMTSLPTRRGYRFFFFYPSRHSSHSTTPLTYFSPVRLVQARQCPTRPTLILFSAQETFSFTLPFSQPLRIYFALALPSSSLLCPFSRRIGFSVLLRVLTRRPFTVGFNFGTGNKTWIAPSSPFVRLHPPRVGGSHGRFSPGTVRF